MASYKDIATLVNTANYTDRVAVSVTFYARFIINENPSTQAHQQRFAWARTSVLSPKNVAAQIANLVALDPVFANQSSPIDLDSVPDTGNGSMQAAVEAAINSTILQYG